MTLDRNEVLRYDEVTLQYVYCFLLPPDAYAAIRGWTEASCWSSRTPDGRRGLTPTLRLTCPLWAESPEDIKILHPASDTIVGRLGSLVRVTETGAGTCTLSLRLEHDDHTLGLAEIHEALALVPRTEEGLGGAPLVVGEQEMSLGEVASRTARDTLGDWWAEILDPGRSGDAIRDQNPFVVTTCQIPNLPEISPPLWGAPGSGTCPDEPAWRELATILLRLADGSDYVNAHAARRGSLRLDLPGLTPGATVLENYAWDSRIYIGFHPRSALCAARSLPQRPASFMMPSVLDMIELLRMHWYGAIAINAMLDRQIERLQRTTFVDMEVFEEVARLRRLWGTLLNDPTAYRFEGGSITSIGQAAREHFWLDQLIELNSQKFDVLDRACEDQLRIGRIRQYSELLDH